MLIKLSFKETAQHNNEFIQYKIMDRYPMHSLEIEPLKKQPQILHYYGDSNLKLWTTINRIWEL